MTMRWSLLCVLAAFFCAGPLARIAPGLEYPYAPYNEGTEDIKKTNAALDPLKLDSDPKVHVLDLWNDLVNADGTLKKGLFTPDNIHLTQDGGYELYATKLKPLVEALLGGKPVPAPAAKPKRNAEAAPSARASTPASAVAHFRSIGCPTGLVPVDSGLETTPGAWKNRHFLLSPGAVSINWRLLNGFHPALPSSCTSRRLSFTVAFATSSRKVRSGFGSRQSCMAV